MPAYITGIGVFLPNQPVDNTEIEKVLGQVGGKRSRTRATVLRSNGIKTRYYAVDPETGKPTHTNCQLTAEAVRELCRRTGFSLTDMDILACGTSGPDQLIPNHSVMVHAALGCEPCEAVSTAGVCASGLTAFKYGYLSVLSGACRNAVTTASELASACMRSSYFTADYQPSDADDEQAAARLSADPAVALEADFLRWMLSDGAAATLITDEPRGGSVSLRIDWVEIFSMAHLADPCMYTGGDKLEDGSFIGWRQMDTPGEAARRGFFQLKQDARQLDELITKLGGETLTMLRERRGATGDDYDWFLPHLSSEYFREPIAQVMAGCDFDIPREKWFTNLSSKGNVGSASVFVMLEELLNGGRLSPGQKLLCFVPESSRFTFGYTQLTVV
ncbi:beta-ketoacyl-ACP synthase III [Streptomyces sp. NPDC091268]|uniref:beta-ketoacyl-ACP synthase III n=1 Tax=Streptomyces sp. NPDC091268 TaxID=3365979 RepID=UPI00381D549C